MVWEDGLAENITVICEEKYLPILSTGMHFTKEIELLYQDRIYLTCIVPILNWNRKVELVDSAYQLVWVKGIVLWDFDSIFIILSYSLDVKQLPLDILFFNFDVYRLKLYHIWFLSLSYNPDLVAEFIPKT
jgi:hypothetical protein